MISGILFACQYLVTQCDEVGLAQEIMRDSNLWKELFEKEQLETDYENEKMLKAIKGAFETITAKE